jgi:hypothetical protein
LVAFAHRESLATVTLFHDTPAEHAPHVSIRCDGRVLGDADEANGGWQAARG